MKTFNIVIDGLNANQRLDKCLLRYLNKAAKSFVYRLLRTKQITLNGHRATGNEILKVGDIVVVRLSEDLMSANRERRESAAVDIKVNVVYEDDNIIVADKPAGMLTHGDGKDDTTTLTDAVAARSGGADFRPAPVHRLDRNTSGLVMFGKNLPATQVLSELIAGRAVKKTYIAVVSGTVDEPKRISHGIKRENNKSSVSDGGKESITIVEPIKSDAESSIVECRLVTGRTHQIRVHLSSVGCPIIGDVKYGSGVKLKDGRILLHAHKLKIGENDGFLSYLSEKTFESDIPDEIKLLGNS